MIPTSTWSDIRIDRAARRPLYDQIAAAIADSILRGDLSAGLKLPSTREMAERLGVHRKTVIHAFERLEASGLVTSSVGQGTFVRPASGDGHAPVNSDRDVPVRNSERGVVPADSRASTRGSGSVGGAGLARSFWDERLSGPGLREPDRLDIWLRSPVPHGCIRLSGATADPSFFPAESVREALDAAIHEHGTSSLDYAPPEGLPALRQWIASRLESRGVPVSPEQIVVVNGSQQGLDLVARLLLVPDDTVLVEEPGYRNGFRLFQSHGIKAMGVPIDAGGLVPDLLEEAVRRERPRLLYTIPAFQNPTGLCLAPDRYEPVLRIAREHGVPILEDHCTADLVYEGEPPRTLMGLEPTLEDRSEGVVDLTGDGRPDAAVDLTGGRRRDGAAEGRVILLGTFSKILFPGLRLGWLALPRALVAPVRELKQTSDLSSSLLTQHAMLRFCREGGLDRHLETIRRINASRLQAAIGAMEREFPPDATWTRPRGGLSLWIRLPGGIDSVRLAERARSAGVDIAPGPPFFPNGGGLDSMRLTYVREKEDRIREGIRILAALMREEAIRKVPAGSRPFL